MGKHGCYASDMLLLWKNRGLNLTMKGNLKTNPKSCNAGGFSKFGWKGMKGYWKFEPKACILNHVWDTSKYTISGGANTRRGESKN